MNYEKTRLDCNRTTRQMKLAHYEGWGLHMETYLNFLFFKICGRNGAAGATTSDLFKKSFYRGAHFVPMQKFALNSLV